MEERIRQTLADIFDSTVAEEARLQNLGGHASLRIYWRIHLPTELDPPRVYPRGETTLMAMVLPEGLDPMESAEGNSSDAPRPRELPFVNVQRYLANIGMPVPAIDRVDMPRGVLILEDLGEQMLEDSVLQARAGSDPEREVINIYSEAIDLLIRFQYAVLRDEKSQSRQTDCIGFTRSFDKELLLWELDHYREWGLEAQFGKDKIAPYKDRLDACFEAIADELVHAPRTLVLRDYQSRNIMWKKDTWILIDFQDALLGPAIYDLVALLRDSYVELTPEQVTELVDYYIECGDSIDLPWCSDAHQVRRLFHLQTIQRKLKDAGRFIYIDRVKNNPSFLDYYDSSIQYVRHALSQLDGFDELISILEDVEPAFTK